MAPEALCDGCDAGLVVAHERLASPFDALLVIQELQHIPTIEHDGAEIPDIVNDITQHDVSNKSVDESSHTRTKKEETASVDRKSKRQTKQQPKRNADEFEVERFYVQAKKRLRRSDVERLQGYHRRTSRKYKRRP